MLGTAPFGGNINPVPWPTVGYASFTLGSVIDEAKKGIVSNLGQLRLGPDVMRLAVRTS